MTDLKKTDISSQDLPLSCPSNQEKLWSAHPKVYLPIEKTGEAACPYCGKVFHLVDFEQFKNRAKGH
jgi:uncharacterized Zn-finger protein